MNLELEYWDILLVFNSNRALFVHVYNIVCMYVCLCVCVPTFSAVCATYIETFVTQNKIKIRWIQFWIFCQINIRPTESCVRNVFFCRYIFLEFQSHHEASEAVKATDGYKLDKQHTFAVNLFSDFDKWALNCMFLFFW